MKLSKDSIIGQKSFDLKIRRLNICYLKPTDVTQLRPSSQHWLHDQTTPYNYLPLRHVEIPLLHIPLRGNRRRVKTNLDFDEIFYLK